MPWNNFVEDLAKVTTYTSASVSIRGNFYRDRVLLNRRTNVSRFSGGNLLRVRRPISFIL